MANLDLVEFDVSADKSSTESENGDSSCPSYQRQDASLAGNSVNKKLPAMTEDRRAATLRANKSVICVFYISQIVILSSNDLSERFKKKKN